MQAQAEVMAKTAANFERTNESLQSMLNGLMSELSVLQTAWQGAGGRSFEQVKQQWARDQRTISRELARTAESIRSSGTGYSTTDDDAAARIAKSHSGISLPL